MCGWNIIGLSQIYNFQSWVVWIGLQLLDKMKDKLHRKSIDEEIDDAFSKSDGDSYSKKVLESSSKFDSSNDDQLSDDYMIHRQPEAQNPVSPPQSSQMNREFQANPNQFNVPGMPTRNPLEMPPEANMPAPRRDEPLIPASRDREYVSTPQERGEFFNSSPTRSSGGSLGSDDVSRILLEIKDLRTQNEHILDLLKNIQDRLRGY